MFTETLATRMVGCGGATHDHIKVSIIQITQMCKCDSPNHYHDVTRHMLN